MCIGLIALTGIYTVTLHRLAKDSFKVVLELIPVFSFHSSLFLPKSEAQSVLTVVTVVSPRS